MTSFVLLNDSRSFVQSCLLCPPKRQQVSFPMVKHLALFFSVHRHLIWLACWVASAALTSSYPTFPVGLSSSQAVACSYHGFHFDKLSDQNRATRLCSSSCLLALLRGRVSCSGHFHSFHKFICFSFLPSALSRFRLGFTYHADAGAVRRIYSNAVKAFYSPFE